MKYFELKQELKQLAIEIRNLKNQRKSFSCGYVPNLFNSQYIFRHKHIVYCLLRGRTMLEIENKVREGNSPNQYLIDKYMKEYTDAKEEALCTCG